MRNKTALGMTLGNMLAAAMGYGGNADASQKGMLDGYKALESQAQADKLAAETAILNRQIEADPYELANRQLGITDSMGETLKRYIQTGDYGNGSMETPNMMPDGTRNLANSFRTEYIKPEGWDDELANRYGRTAGALKYGIDMGEKNPETAFKAVRTSEENAFLDGRTSQPVSDRAYREGALKGDVDKIVKTRAFEDVAAGNLLPDQLENLRTAFTIDDPAKAAGGMTELQKLIAARDALPAGHPDRAFYDSAISKNTTHAPAPSASVVMPPVEKAGRTKMAEFDANAVDAARLKAEGARNSLPLIRRMKNAQKNAASGFFAPGLVGLANIANSLGLADEQTKKMLADSQMFSQGSEAFAASMLKALMGSSQLSNADLAMVQKLAPRLEQSPDARRQLIDYAEKQAKMFIAEHENMRRYFESNSGSLAGYQPLALPEEEPAPAMQNGVPVVSDAQYNELAPGSKYIHASDPQKVVRTKGGRR